MRVLSHGVSVLYHDEHLVALNKPSGLIVHRGLANDSITLADIVRDELIAAPVHAIHRLDRGTSGVILFALSSETARYMQEQLTSPETSKRYIALVRGPM